MDSPAEKARDSILPAYDALMRDVAALYATNDENLAASIKMASDYEVIRIKYADSLRELSSKNAEIDKLQKEAHLQELRLSTVRKAFTRESLKYDQLMKDYKQIKRMLTTVQELLNDERAGKNTAEYSIVSIISNLKDIDNIKSLPAQDDSANISDDGLLFDKSEESLDNILDGTFAAPSDVSIISSNVATPAASDSRPATSTPNTDSPQFLPSTVNTNSPRMLAPSTSRVTLSGGLNSSICMHRLNAMRGKARLDTDRLDVKGHNFAQKKTFTSIVCGACGKNIGFCSKYLICKDCRSPCHENPQCQAALPRPCTPSTSSSAAFRRMQSGVRVGQMIVLGDFAQASLRPCVPALLIHCCNELDRRVEEAKKNDSSSSSLFTFGKLYLDKIVEKEAKELRNRFLTKDGIPNLGNVKPNILCSVVKCFLRDLDDPMITRIMWNDFVRAADHVHKLIIKTNDALTDSDYESQQGDENDGIESTGSDNEEWQETLGILKGVIVQLPNANRDSLCFLFIHFHRLLDSPEIVKLSAEEISQAFAPLIVGSYNSQSTARLSLSGDTRREGEKQMMVMQTFFKLSRTFWDSLLKDPKFCPFGNIPQDPNCSYRFNTSVRTKRSTTNLKEIIKGHQNVAY